MDEDKWQALGDLLSSQIAEIANALVDQVSVSLGLQLDPDFSFRRWDDEGEVCTILSVRRFRAWDQWAADIEIGFYSKTCVEHFFGERQLLPTIEHVLLPDLVFGASRFVKHGSGLQGWLLRSLANSASLQEVKQIVACEFPPLMKSLGSLGEWPAYLEAKIASLPGAHNKLLSLLVYVLLKRNAPWNEIEIAFNRHALLKDRLNYHLINQREMIRSRFGTSKADDLESRVVS